MASAVSEEREEGDLYAGVWRVFVGIGIVSSSLHRGLRFCVCLVIYECIDTCLLFFVCVLYVVLSVCVFS